MAAITRKSYHTQLKHLVREGLLDHEQLRLIPRTNIHRWKYEAIDKYKTFGIADTSWGFKDIKRLAQIQKAKRIFAAFVRIVKTVLGFSHALSGFHRSVKENSQHVVDLVKRVQPLIGLRVALRFFNISVPTYRLWSIQSASACFTSLTNACNRVFPNQLSRPEVIKLREMVEDKQFQYWPISSIAFHALKENILPLSLNTWYKYVHKLGLARIRPASRRKKGTVGIRALRPHQLWHADITVFVTADQVKHYIYLVVDNFSRKVLAWMVAGSVRAELRKKTIEDALRSVKESIPSITLITDGGPENELNDFLATLEQPIEHQVALVDIQYSNSLIEAHNKTIKYNYLYRMDIADGGQLEKAIKKTVLDFNDRPHVSLNGLTPNEAEQGIALEDIKLKGFVALATDRRRAYNLANRCEHCRS